MRRLFQALFVIFFALPATAHAVENGVTVKSVRSFSYAAFTRIVLETEAAAPYVVTKTADGHALVLSAYDGPLQFTSPLPVINDSIVAGIEARDDGGRKYLLIQLGPAAGDVKDFVLRGPDRIVLDVAKRNASATVPPAANKSVVVVVLDPGHGGKDGGIATPQGEEKTLALELALAVKKNLQKDEKFKVVMTRDKDMNLSLDDRAAAANAARADLFVSIHTAPGSSSRVFIQDPDEDLGTEQPTRPAGTDFLGFEADSTEQESLWDRLQAGHVKESGLLGRIIARELDGTETAEPVQAPMAELKSVDAAAVMIEIGLDEDRAKTAEAVVKGIEQYAGQNR